MALNPSTKEKIMAVCLSVKVVNFISFLKFKGITPCTSKNVGIKNSSTYTGNARFLGASIKPGSTLVKPHIVPIITLRSEARRKKQVDDLSKKKEGDFHH